MKRVICLALLLCQLNLPLSARAEEPVTESATVTCLNPLYPELTEADLNPPQVPAARPYSQRVYTSIADAGAYLSEMMVQRAESISVTVRTASSDSTLYSQIFQAACAHTGNPQAGDYHLFHYAGYKVSYLTSAHSGYVETTLDYTMTYYTTAQQEELLGKYIDHLLYSLDLEGQSDFAKLCLIYDYVCNNVDYDHDTLNDDSYKLKYTAYAALVNGTSVCQGYANLMYRLLLSAGLDARIVRGSAGGPHAWNLVKLGQEYYFIDATWDAVRVGNYQYFLLSDADMAKDHAKNTTAEFDVAYPIADTSVTTHNQGHSFRNGSCTICTAKQLAITPGTDCLDLNKNHLCDVCDAKLTNCADRNNDHLCDLCSQKMTSCADDNHDHSCDTCGQKLTNCADLDKNHQCDTCQTAMGTHASATGSHMCNYCGKQLSTCSDSNGDSLCDICGIAMRQPVSATRVAGDNRFDTALKTAGAMKTALGLEKFDAIILASGHDFADALAGSYLSAAKNAPILLIYGQSGKYAYLDTNNINYIKENLTEGGTVYILGGENAVPALDKGQLSEYNVKRLDGANRFETNQKILREVGITAGSEILVCTSQAFADSLSASATGKPILLVTEYKGTLYGVDDSFLSGLENCTFTIVGGESAVGEEFKTLLSNYGTVERLAGDNRFETSVMVAQRYFQNPDSVVLAYAWNFPDGLCGGALAHALGGPLVLTMNGYEQAATNYAKANDFRSAIILGGSDLISDEAVRTIFNLY